ncbi:MAG TPA: tetratricopeptide repeat protein, partial [Anaerolineales bacterium]
DHTSIELLQFLLASLSQAPILVIAISRPFELGALGKLLKWSRLNLGPQFVSIQLQNLTAEESEQLLYQLLSIPDLPESLRETILQRSAGIPFYLEEILRMLMDQQLIQREKGRWSLAPNIDTASLGVPATLQELILARFDQLDPVQRAILQAASVLGHQFSLTLLKTVLVTVDEKCKDEFLFLVAFSLLMDRAFLVPCPESANQEYRFKQVLVSDTIYNTLLKRERSHLHGVAAEAIEALYADRLDEQIEILASHYQRSTNLERALHYLLLAGQKASREYANSQARQYFEQALALLGHTPHTAEQALQVRMGLGNVLVFIGEYASALEQYQEALNIITAAGAGRFTRERSELHRRMSTAYERQGDYSQAIQCLALAQQTLDEIHIALPIERALILNDTGWINFRQGNLEEAEQRLVQALALIENTARNDVIASIYNRLGGVYYQKDQVDLASEYVGKSLKLREEIGDIVGAARSCNNLGLLSWKRGEWGQALENFTRSVALHANLGDVEGMIELHSNLGLLLIDQGESEEAQKHLSEALAKPH